MTKKKRTKKRQKDVILTGVIIEIVNDQFVIKDMRTGLYLDFNERFTLKKSNELLIKRFETRALAEKCAKEKRLPVFR